MRTHPAFSYRSPFHPEQCRRAIDAAGRDLLRDASNHRSRLLLAEGFLCRGLEDDPWALDEAIRLFRQIVRDDPSNFFAQLEYADAVRKRFPLSEEAQAALQKARALLERVDVGAARVDLEQYIDANLEAVTDYRARALPLLQQTRAAFKAGALSPTEVAGFVAQLALTGEAGIAEAEKALNRYLASHPDDALATAHRAELLRGRAGPAVVQELYVQAQARLCPADPAAPPHGGCDLARWRLRQLRARDETL